MNWRLGWCGNINCNLCFARFTSAVLCGENWELPLPPFGQGWWVSDSLVLVQKILLWLLLPTQYWLVHSLYSSRRFSGPFTWLLLFGFYCFFGTRTCPLPSIMFFSLNSWSFIRCGGEDSLGIFDLFWRIIYNISHFIVNKSKKVAYKIG